MTPLDKLLARADPLFKTAAFDASKLPAGMPLHATHKALLQRRNGGYFWGGALHVFGACDEPDFHSLIAWNTPETWRELYGEDLEGLFFFAEDAFGDQFALDAQGHVLRLKAESGALEELADDFDQWVLIVVEATDELLGRGTFADWASQNGRLPPGSQLQAFPPYLFAEDPDMVQLEAVDAVENMQFHGAIAAQLAALPEGAAARIEITDEGIQIVPADPAEIPKGDDAS